MAFMAALLSTKESLRHESRTDAAANPLAGLVLLDAAIDVADIHGRGRRPFIRESLVTQRFVL
jgi:hypothetical protein